MSKKKQQPSNNIQVGDRVVYAERIHGKVMEMRNNGQAVLATAIATFNVDVSSLKKKV